MTIGEEIANIRLKQIEQSASKFGVIGVCISFVACMVIGGFSSWGAFIGSLIAAFFVGGVIYGTRRKSLLDKEKEFAIVRAAHEPAGFK